MSGDVAPHARQNLRDSITKPKVARSRAARAYHSRMKRFALPLVTLALGVGLGFGLGDLHTGATAPRATTHSQTWVAGNSYAGRYMQAYLANSTTAQIWCNSRAVEVSHPAPAEQWIKGCESRLIHA